MKSTEDKSTEVRSTYESPVLTVLGAVHDLTEGFPGGPVPDALNPNHNTISGR
jgi:hypothetical protein